MEQIIFNWNEDCEKELISMGFEKREVYIKTMTGPTDQQAKNRGEHEIFSMAHKPYRFCVSSAWGACLD